MRKQIVSLFALVALLGMMLPGAAFAQDERLQDLSDTTVVDSRLEKATGTVGVMVQLTGEPSMVTYARAKTLTNQTQASRNAIQRLAEIEREQVRLVNELTALNATVIYRAQRTYNGIAVYVDASNLDAIAKLNGVEAVRPLTKHTVDNRYSVELIGAPQLWQGLIDAGVELTGDGVSVGIIDTGIDYIHTDFGGPGTEAAYNANDTEVVTDTIPGLTGTVSGQSFPTAKVVGGYDFVGDDYNADPSSASYQPIPNPDEDPMDCNGHGTHVAGTAAGLGVNDDGSTYTGPYNTDLSNEDFRIGPGVAPEADLYALRVFGCGGSTDVTVAAIEWAVDPDGDGDPSDHLDVINMSLGSSDGSGYDESAVASDSAMLAGVIVVASAGNSGDSFYITGAPGVSARAISVASSIDSATVTDAIRVTASPADALNGLHPALFSVRYDWAGDPTVVSGDLYYTTQDACQASDFATGEVTGKIVILVWADGQCGSVTRSATIRNAGGVGFIFVDNSEYFDLFLSGDAIIPGVSIPLEVGQALIAALDGNTETITVEFDPSLAQEFTYVNDDFNDLLSAFSSRGPRRFDNALKPDLTAPGQSIFSAATGTGDGGRTLSGTSMAAPHVAGSMALLRQLHPVWDVEDLKALVMNTASKNLRSDIPSNSGIYNPSRIGAGRVDLVDAANSDVIMYNGDELGYVSVSFGAVDVLVTDTAELSKTVWVENLGPDTYTYTVGYNPVLTIPGVNYTVEPSTVVVEPGSPVSLTVTMMADGATMERTRDETVAATQLGSPRHYLSEASGNIVLNDTSNEQNTMFMTTLTGSNEVPRVNTTVRADATLMLNMDGTVSYIITPSTTITTTAGHIHDGDAGSTGGVVTALDATGTFGPSNPISGTTAMLTFSQISEMYRGGYYINLHTSEFPAGFIRGQIGTASADLRLPVYANARPISRMMADETSFDFTGTMSGTDSITLSGVGLNSGGYESIVSTFELVDSFMNQPDPEPFVDQDAADLKYLGITSSYTSTMDNAELFFGIATWDDWTTLREVEFDIYFDIDEDGVDDYVVYTSDFGTANNADGTDTFVTRVLNLSTNTRVTDQFVNYLAATTDTNVFNNNVVVIPVTAATIGLTDADSTFNYRVVTFTSESSGSVDSTGSYRYDAANKTFDFGDFPFFDDQDGETINFDYNAENNEYNNSEGILLIHHHNGGDMTAEVIDVTNLPGADRMMVFLPIVRK